MISFFTTLWSTLWTTLALAAVGALVGTLSYFVGKLTSWWVSAIAGAILVVGAYGSGSLSQLVSDNAKAQIAALESANAKLEFELKSQLEVAEFEADQVKVQTKRAQEAEAQLEKINQVIAKHGEADCPVGAFRDELDEIRKLK
jgi:LPS O-antigen subunit length determinant protein (WzzB/FepE family)